MDNKSMYKTPNDNLYVHVKNTHKVWFLVGIGDTPSEKKSLSGLLLALEVNSWGW